MDPVSKSRLPDSRRLRSGVDPQVGKDTQFKPGVSGNPGGKLPKSLLQRRLEEVANDDKFVEQAIESICKRVRQTNMAGVLETRELLDRVEGKVTQAVDMNLTGTVVLAEIIAERRKKRGNGSNSQS